MLSPNGLADLAAFLLADRAMARFLRFWASKLFVRDVGWIDKVDGLVEVSRVNEAGRVNEAAWHAN